MKTTYKAIISVVLAIVIGVVVQWIFVESSKQTDDSVMTVYQDMMLQSREMFVEKADDYQLVTLALLEAENLNIVTDSEGTPWVMAEDGSKQHPADVISGELQPYLDNVFGSYANGGKLYNIAIMDTAILFYTSYHQDGSVGFLYERELGTVTDFTELLELTENWKIFYDMPEE